MKVRYLQPLLNAAEHIVQFTLPTTAES